MILIMSLEEILSLKLKVILFLYHFRMVFTLRIKLSKIFGKERVCAGVAQISSYIDNKQTIIHVGN